MYHSPECRDGQSDPSFQMGIRKVHHYILGQSVYFNTSHAYGMINRGRGPLTPEGKDIKNKEKILTLLGAICFPPQITVLQYQATDLAT